jgi:AcrR family transcriptional regulator
MTTRREALKARRHDAVREEILEAARSVMLAQGLSGFTLTAVGRELALSKAALYYYFNSKESLFFELIYVHL